MDDGARARRTGNGNGITAFSAQGRCSRTGAVVCAPRGERGASETARATRAKKRPQPHQEHRRPLTGIRVRTPWLYAPCLVPPLNFWRPTLYANRGSATTLYVRGFQVLRTGFSGLAVRARMPVLSTSLKPETRNGKTASMQRQGSDCGWSELPSG